jgi:O-antigen/teichoic acid export membrane protein
MTLIGLPASAFTLLMARETSRDRAIGHGASAALLHSGNRTLLLAGTGLAGAFALSSAVIGRFLDVPVALLIVAAAGMPFAFAMPLLLGEFQGEQRFVAFSLLATTQAAFKLVGAITLGLLYGPLGIIAGISLSGGMVYVAALYLLRRKLAINPRLPWFHPALKYLAVIVPSTLALGVLLSSDVLIVKHFFRSQDAGEYSAVAAIGRAVFWGAAGVAGVLFPKVVFRESQGNSGVPLIAASLVLVALGGAAGMVLLSLGSAWLLTAFAGVAYVKGAIYLPWYTLGMTLLGGAAVLIATQQSRANPAFLAALIPLTALESVLLVLFHDSLMQVVQILDLSMAVLLGGLAVQFILQRRNGRLDRDTHNPLVEPIRPTRTQTQESR